MSNSIVTASVSRVTTSRETIGSGPAPTAPVVAAINTILAVQEHAPAEILELEAIIATLQLKLNIAFARKRLLEQLVETIQDAAPAVQIPSGGQAPMVLVR